MLAAHIAYHHGRLAALNCGTALGCFDFAVKRLIPGCGHCIPFLLRECSSHVRLGGASKPETTHAIAQLYAVYKVGVSMVFFLRGCQFVRRKEICHDEGMVDEGVHM